MNRNLSSIAVLVEFNASVWTARKLDKGQSDKVVIEAGARQRDAARVNKNLLAGRPELDEIQSIVGAARTYVYSNTTPWSDNGQRFLMAKRIPEFDAAMQQFRKDFDAQVESFINVYPSLITAQAMALGDMFKRDEYPLASEIARKFGFTYEMFPVPNSGHFEIDFINEVQDDLRNRLEAVANARMAKVMTDVQDRIVEHLRRMETQLTTDVDGKRRKLYESLITTAHDLCALTRDYNVTNDPRLSATVERLESKLEGVTIETLKEDGIKREEVRQEVTALLNAFDSDF